MVKQSKRIIIIVVVGICVKSSTIPAAEPIIRLYDVLIDDTYILVQNILCD